MSIALGGVTVKPMTEIGLSLPLEEAKGKYWLIRRQALRINAVDIQKGGMVTPFLRLIVGLLLLVNWPCFVSVVFGKSLNAINYNPRPKNKSATVSGRDTFF